jgi:hypothetical protein
MCSVSCFHFSKIEGLTADIIKAERAELLKKKKETLMKFPHMTVPIQTLSYNKISTKSRR